MTATDRDQWGVTQEWDPSNQKGCNNFWEGWKENNGRRWDGALDRLEENKKSIYSVFCAGAGAVHQCCKDKWEKGDKHWCDPGPLLEDNGKSDGLGDIDGDRIFYEVAPNGEERYKDFKPGELKHWYGHPYNQDFRDHEKDYYGEDLEYPDDPWWSDGWLAYNTYL